MQRTVERAKTVLVCASSRSVARLLLVAEGKSYCGVSLPELQAVTTWPLLTPTLVL